MSRHPKRVGLRAASLVLATVFAAATPAYSQEISLRMNDGSIEVSGTLLSFNGESYRLMSQLGEINIDASQVQCVAGPCPLTASATETSVQTGPVVWDVSLWGSRRAFTEHIEKLAELVEQKTDGALTLNISYGGLSPAEENLDGIAAGRFEMAQFCAGYHPEKTPTLNVLELPFLGVSTLEEERAVSEAVYRHPATMADLARWNATLLMPTPQPQYNILGVGFPPTSLASFQTMTVRATGGSGDAIAALGATTVNLPAPDVREALASGAVNAVAFAPHAHLSFRTIENGVWWTTNLNPGTANCPVVVNAQALASLPPESRIALLSSVEEALDFFIANYTDVTMGRWEAALQDNEIIQITITDEIIAAINEEVAGPAADAWIAETSALGVPAQEIYDMVTTMLQNGS